MSWADTIRQVESRAGQRCEYCRMHQSLQGATFHVEHIHPTAHGGSDELSNLALACPGCNLKKSDRREVCDPESGAMVSLFHPRTDRWEEHFRWEGYQIVGITSIGRALVASFDLNHLRRQRIRQAEEYFTLFPPTD